MLRHGVMLSKDIDWKIQIFRRGFMDRYLLLFGTDLNHLAMIQLELKG
jgi:hypothetical protein